MYNWSNQMSNYYICTTIYTKGTMTNMDNNNQWPFYLGSGDLTKPHI
jgi:hypothetical protein